MSERYKSKVATRGLGRGMRPTGGPIEKPKDGWKTLKRLASYLGREQRMVVVLILVVCVGVAAHVVAPGFQSNAIDAITLGRFDHLPGILGWMITFYGIYGCCMLLQGYITSLLSQKVIQRMRKDLFSRMMRLPISYLDAHSHGDLISRMTNDAENISNVISESLSSLVSGVLTLVGTFAMMTYYSLPLALISCSTVALSLGVISLLTKYMRIYYVKRQVLLGQLNGTVEEYITNIKTVKAYSLEKEVVEQFSTTADHLTRTGIISEAISGSMGPCMNMISNVAFVVVAVFGAYFALEGYITVGVISAFIVYSKQFSRPLNEIAQLYGQIQTAIAGAERIFEVLEEQVEEEDGEVLEGACKGVIEFSHVDFSYVPEKKVISDFSLRVEAGKKIALVGSTGSGKTTIINLLMRFYDADAGSITLDGKEITSLSLKDLRDHIGIVLQDTILFSDTVWNNLSYADATVTKEEMEHAAKISSADHVIAHLSQGYETLLKESGASLSQGERQLLAIGRAFVSKPDILILDEATSSVDTRTEKRIQDAMQELMKNRTSLIIAHRLSTIVDADEIIVMDQGKIVEQGSHASLLAKRGQYYQLYMTQYAGQAI
ncbi:MAG: ABC transporter ATP-binding protein/permease [Lachnospiraceae bacterium]|nr:ABC transporter ATP-binding protein/permease [Lachnospiraceae bacterium]